MVKTRSRTGCLTCRDRKLKCDEHKPICGQCHKASRECRASDLVAFRHHQNPSMNATGSQAGSHLPWYFNNKKTFDPNQTWVKIPPKITFVHTNNPYDDDDDDLDVDPALTTEPQTSLDAPRADWDLDTTYRPSTSDFVAHSLEHLAAAASDQNPYDHARGSGVGNGMMSSAPHYAPYHSQDLSPPLATSARGMLANASPTGSYSSNNNINSLLNHSNTLSTVIDPLLRKAMPRQPAVSAPRVTGGKPVQKGARKGKVQDDHEMAALLRGIAEEHPGHRNEGSLVTNG